MTELCWLRKLKSTPCDEFTFRALQDWLEERGDPRAENFRLSRWKLDYLEFYWPCIVEEYRKYRWEDLITEEGLARIYCLNTSHNLIEFLLTEYPR